MTAPRAPHRDARLTPRTRRILHVDVDAFLASVERADHPELAGKPVVVGGRPDSRNLVMSCSYEARACGVRAGMSPGEVARLCPQAIFRDGNAQSANAKRADIARVLLEFSPLVEIASIDDFFVDVTGTQRLLGAACDVAAAARAAILARTRLPVTVGIATTRTMARLAGKLAKPGGVGELLPGHENAFLARMPVRHLPGVGPAIGRELEQFAIRTAGDLARVSREVLFATFGTAGLVLHERTHGRDPDPVAANCRVTPEGELVQRPPRSISRDSTFEPEEGRAAILASMLAYLVDRAAAHARAHGLRAGSVEVRVAYVDTLPARLRRRDPNSNHWQSVRRAPAHPTDSTAELTRHALALLETLPRRRALVRRVGITLARLSARRGHQGVLFSDPEVDGPRGSRADREHRLDLALDALRARHGFASLLRGTSLPLEERFPLERDGFRLRTPSLNQ
ncbi:MAG: DNA polymerase IV [bacterium]|nr:DNA polymerase IV [bacterium]